VARGTAAFEASCTVPLNWAVNVAWPKADMVTMELAMTVVNTPTTESFWPKLFIAFSFPVG
jgi:hypothetical protein